MKGQFRGLSKIFSFTFIQHVKSKGYKNTTIIIGLLCLLIPALIMTGIEYLGSDDTSDVDSTDVIVSMEQLNRVLVVDMTEGEAFDTSLIGQAAKEMTGTDMEIVNMGKDFDTARSTASGTSDTLIMVIEQEGTLYKTNIVIPDGSNISEDVVYQFQSFIDQYTQTVSGEYVDQPDDEDPVEGIQGGVTLVVSYLNIMVLYFFVLAYGQGVANSVVMEKSSKLMENFLISVKPTAIVLGKLLAITATGIIQFFTWILSLVISFAAGTAIVKSINPDTDMLVIRGFEMLKELLDGMFSPRNCIMAILMIMLGMLLYCALAGIGGAMASKTEDLSAANVIFTMALVISFFAALVGGGFGESMDAAPWLDWIPFTSVLVTPGRVLMGTLPLWKTALCFVISLITALLATALAGKIYKTMVLYKGDIPKPADIIKMLKRA